MAFQVNTLPDYVEQKKGELLSKAVFGFETRQYVNLMTGVKYKEALNILATDPVLQTRTCGFDASGNVSFTQRVMTVAPYKVNMSLCEEDLRKKWMNDQLVVKAGGEVLPFEEKITENIVKGVNKQLESLIWNATNASNGFDGLLTIAKAEADVIDVSAGASDYATALEVYKAIPAEILDKAEIFVGEDQFRSIVLEITAKNLYHYNPEVDGGKTIILPGTNTKLHGVPGLSGKGQMLAADPENLFYGVDMADDAESFDIWYSKDNQEFRVAIKFNAGAQVAFPDQIVLSEAAQA
jgi:hypothetical protein